VPTYTVSQVASYIRSELESDPHLADLWIEGEVSNLSIASSGHAYFNLKDRQAVLQAVMFRSQRGIHLLANGDSVTAHGRVSFYEPRGTLNIMVDVVAPQGLGELALELERLKQKLASEGLFDPSRKRPLPAFPKVIGVVTSPTGAVFHDIQNVLSRRFPLAKLVLSPTQVQGDGAAASIASALELLDREGGCDVIIVARGGGSLEDLWSFNEEVVARAIYACSTPVVSGVGHETDETIADYVADVRAPTPSAAAELIVPDARDLKSTAMFLLQRMSRSLATRVEQEREGVNRLRRQMEAGLPDIPTLRRRIDDLGRIAGSTVASLSTQRRLEVDGVNQRLRGLDPRATLSRGFAVVEVVKSGVALTSTGQVSSGDELRITVSDGEVAAVAGESGQGDSSKAGMESASPASPVSSDPAPVPARRKRKAKAEQPPASALLL
jgi:exodeoxyribonuclease VII large subunit